MFILWRELDQGCLHPKLEVLRLTCLSQESNPRPPQWEASTQERSHLNSLLMAIRNIWPRDQWRMLVTWLPQCMCYINIHEHTWTALRCRPNRTCKASAKHLPAAKTSGTCKSQYSLSSRTDHVVVTTMKRLDQAVLRPKLEVPRLTCLGRESSLASTVGGKHFRKEPFEQLVNCYSEHLHMSTWTLKNAHNNILKCAVYFSYMYPKQQSKFFFLVKPP